MMRMTGWAVVAIAGLAVACAETPTTPLAVEEAADARAERSLKPAEYPTIVDLAVEDGRFTTLVAAVTAAGLADDLAAKGQRTVFAPTDDAFAALPAGTVDFLLQPQNLEALQNILLYHVAPGERFAEDVVTSEQIRMLNGGFAEIEVNASGVFIDGAQIIITDLEASNGVIHVVNAVLLP